MQFVPDTAVAKWNADQHAKVPAAVDLICPLCGRRVCFAPTWSFGSHPQVLSTSARCPGCSGRVTFVIVEARAAAPGQDATSGKLYVHPDSRFHQPMEGIDSIEALSGGLKDVYMSILNVLNVGEPMSTAGMCRVLLEGITKTLLPEEKRRLNLSLQIKSMSELDLGEPIRLLADAVRESGNLGSHFDIEKKPDLETAQMMVELVEYLIAYLFVLPKRIELFHQKVAQLGQHRDAETEVSADPEV